jgi:hypothetical protein
MIGRHMIRPIRAVSGIYRSIGGAPSIGNRFFLLSMNIDLEHDDARLRLHDHTEQLLNKRQALLSFEAANGHEAFVLFHCENECMPYDFVKQVRMILVGA